MNIYLFLLILFVLTRSSSRAETYCISECKKHGSQCNIEIKCDPNRPREINSTRLIGEVCCSSARRVAFSIKSSLMINSILDDKISFYPIFNDFPIDCQKKNKLFVIAVATITGIHRSFKVAAFAPGHKQITMLVTRLSMMENEQERVDCSKNLNASVFASDEVLDIIFSLGVKYEEDTCEQLFHMAKISFLKMYSLADSMIKRNIFGIAKTSGIKDLRSDIGIVTLKGFAIALNENSFPMTIFSQTRLLVVQGVLKRFQAEILIGSRMNKIILEISSVRKFLHDNLYWLDFTNHRLSRMKLSIDLYGRKQKLNKFKNDEEFYSESQPYEYLYQIDGETTVFDNTTFCIIYRFYRKNLNLEIYGQVFRNQAKTTCDCALFWILKTYNPDYLDFDGASEECGRRHQELDKSCDFDAMAARCNLKTIEPIAGAQGYSFVLPIKFTHFVLNTVMTSSLSCVAFALNLFVVYVFHRMRSSEQFRKKKLTDKNQSLWTYVYYNAIFVSLQALIFAFEPLTACIQNDGIYCSPLILTHLGQGFYLFVQSYLGNALRLIANVTNSLFVLYRFGMNADRLAKLRKAKPKKVVFICMLPVLLISVITLFVNERFDLKVLNDDPFNYLFRDIYEHELPTLTLKIIFLTNMILGNIVFNLLNVIVDLRLLIFLRTLKSASRKEEVEARVTKMIVLNGVFSFLFRTPEMAFSISYLVFTFNPLLFPSCELTRDITLSACPSLAKISQFFFSFSFFENFILLYLFNPEFNQQARKIFGKHEEKRVKK
nr:G protein-coupled receptor [Proales similis]